MSQCETGSRTAAVGVSQPKIEEGVRRLISVWQLLQALSSNQQIEMQQEVLAA